jgi:large subunit ribosomal protein L23
MTGIIYRPIVTEKITAMEGKQQYAFEVALDANKIEIAKAVSKKFNVTVMKVRTMNYAGKSKVQLTRKGRFSGKTAHFKKAVVTIKEGQKIELFENV